MPGSGEKPLIVTPLRVEEFALRSARAGLPVLRVGMRANRALALRRIRAAYPAAPVVVAGLAGGLTEHLRPGDVVVADEVRSTGTVIDCPGGAALAEELRQAGWRVHLGPVVESAHLVDGWERAELADAGAVAVDMESARLLRSLGGRAADVVRVVVDTPHRPLRHPATLSGGWLALGTLRAIARVLGRCGSGRPAPVAGQWWVQAGSATLRSLYRPIPTSPPTSRADTTGIGCFPA